MNDKALWIVNTYYRNFNLFFCHSEKIESSPNDLFLPRNTHLKQNNLFCVYQFRELVGDNKMSGPRLNPSKRDKSTK